MSSQAAPIDSPEGISASVVVRWMTKAALFGLFVGVWVGMAALRAG